MKKSTVFHFVVLMGALGLGSCSDSEKNAILEVRLTDAPGDFQQVNIDIQGVQVHVNEGEQPTGWRSLDIQSGVYNLLDLTNGLDTLLGTTEIPAGKISQIRLILGDDNTVTLDGVDSDLVVPSGQQSGLKINVNAVLTEGITYRVLLDFDVARSIVHRGNGVYNLKPVIRSITEATTGAISGSIDNPLASPAVYAVVGADTVATTFANDQGHFLIRGIPAGTYVLSFAPASGFIIADVEGVTVSIGQVTAIGEISVVEE